MRKQCHRPLGIESLEPRQMLAVAPVVITEIMYHPMLTPDELAAGLKESALEFIELQNTGRFPVPLAGVSLSDGVSFTFGDTTLAPGQYVVVVGNREAFDIHYGSGRLVAGEFQGSLKNKGEHITLADATGATILDFTFDDAWYDVTDGGGYSLTIVDPMADASAWSQPSGWKPSARVGGSPGFDDGAEDPRPKNLTATVLSSRDVALHWEPPADAVSAIQEYVVYRDDLVLGSTRQTSFTDTTVHPAASYSYRVSAVRVDSLEYSSNPISVAIEAVGGNPEFAAGESRGLVQIDGLQELSGLVASRRNLNVLWTHNDGPQDTVHAINTRGEWVGWLQLPGVPSRDWEDIAIGPGPEAGVDYLYIGDIGGNNNDRTVVQVYRVPEPLMASSGSDQGNIVWDYDTLTLQYPDGQGFDAETLLSDPQTGDLYVLTKEPRTSHVYRASASELSAGRTITMELVGQLDFSVASGGDISPMGTEIVIRNERVAWLFARGEDQSVADALAGPHIETPVIGRPVEPNGEGITFGGLDREYYTISEGPDPPLYSFRRLAPAQAGDANRDLQFDQVDLVMALRGGKFNTEQPALWSEGDWNGDGVFDQFDIVAALQTGNYLRGPYLAYDGEGEPMG